ncbi:TetR/AcrR family transcriptional regulator [Amycolatopsis sp. NPDC059657]|uniref:TetR/AcrR family transcriptional regulator n=1 Tax=Amycolatopsis sp. NPDC059657 TaxID=3346899 RepID=UPI003671153C
MAGRRTDTRDRIQDVALELFSEKGYDGTSLREIAERLDVTKAALYYHFRTKEDIVQGLVGDAAEGLAEIVEQGRALDPAEAKIEVLTRFAALIEGRLGQVMRFMQQNIPALKEMGLQHDLGEKMKGLFELLCAADEDAEAQLRARLALVALVMGNNPLFGGGEFVRPDSEVALKVALELASPTGGSPKTAT